MRGTKEDVMAETLYKRLGGYDAIAAVADNLLPRLTADSQLGRFWQHRGEDGVRREKQLLIDFLCASAGSPLHYVGREMKLSHRGLGINERDWQVFLGHVNATLDHFEPLGGHATSVDRRLTRSSYKVVNAQYWIRQAPRTVAARAYSDVRLEVRDGHSPRPHDRPGAGQACRRPAPGRVARRAV